MFTSMAVKWIHPRFITRDLAKAIAEAGGGVLGAWPAGIGIADLDGYVRRMLDLVEAVGIDHVCLGTDMDANYKQRSILMPICPIWLSVCVSAVSTTTNLPS